MGSLGRRAVPARRDRAGQGAAGGGEEGRGGGLRMSEPKGRGVAWTEERGTSDEGRRCPEASGRQSRYVDIASIRNGGDTDVRAQRSGAGTTAVDAGGGHGGAPGAAGACPGPG